MIGTAILFSFGCAKEVTVTAEDQEKSYFDAWMKINHPDLKPFGLGVYIMEDVAGTGDLVTDNDSFVFVEYTVTDLSGNVSGTSHEKLAQQIGSFSAANYYGANAIANDRGYTATGVLETIRGMRVGGTRKAIIPSWLNYTADYDTEEEYIKNSSGSNAIYTITVVDKTDDIIEWQLDSLRRFARNQMAGVDSTMSGYYYLTTREPSDTTTFRSDTSYYINYVGRLLDGHVFDTTIEDTAKVHGIWSSTKTYGPVHITMAEKYSEITMSSNGDSGSTLVDGFSFCLSRLRPYEKGICAFYSELGYGASGSDAVIPGYCPISFEIDVVDEPEG